MFILQSSAGILSPGFTENNSSAVSVDQIIVPTSTNILGNLTSACWNATLYCILSFIAEIYLRDVVYFEMRIEFACVRFFYCFE